MPWEIQQGVSTEVIAIHAALLPTSEDGDVLCFGDWTNPGATTHSRIYHVADGDVEPFDLGDLPNKNLFCGGQAFLSDGRLLVAGGTKAWPEDPTQMLPEHLHEHHYNGERASWIYLPRAAKWVPAHSLNTQPDSDTRGGGRWYPTLVTLANGEVFAAGGHPATGYPDPAEEDSYKGRHNNNTPERYSPVADDWALMTADTTAPNNVDNDSYPRFHLLPSGLLFSDTAGNETAKRIFDPFAGVWTGPNVDVSALPGYYGRGSSATSVLLPLLPPDYRPRVLACNSPDATAFRIDVDASPAWVATADRKGNAAGLERTHGCAVLLPTGQVFLSGGVIPSEQVEGQPPVPNVPVLEPELYTPGINWAAGDFSGEEEWTALGDPATVGRGYHSVALLLPDGRVWTAGSTEGFGAEEKRVEIYSPWYVGGSRPTIESAPPSIGYVQEFAVKVGANQQISRVALIRCGSVTHAFDSDQRYVGLTFEQRGPVLTVSSPLHGGIAPPGNYLLWVVDEGGHPCELAAFVRLSRQKALISADISTYSLLEVEALGLPAEFPTGLYLVYDGFLPSEVSPPDVTLRRPDNSAPPGLTWELGAPVYEAGAGAEDVAQRIAFPLHFTFTSDQAFDEMPQGEDFQSVTVRATMRQFASQTTIQLSKNPNPRMRDGEPPWLSIDLRAFTTRPGDELTAGVEHGSGGGAPYEYIKDVVQAFDTWDEPGVHPFEHLPQSQAGNPLPLYPADDDGPLYSYAVARVGYRAPEGMPAEDVRVFFRLWTTGWSAMAYDEHGSYRRSGNGANAVPLLGLTGTEINNIPCFAEPRKPDMTKQEDFVVNRKTLVGDGPNIVYVYFGCWLDQNQDVPLFPREPEENNGPFTGELQTIQELMRGLHQCLVAEIHYLEDPNRSGDTPTSSDNLAQRNLLLDKTPNPGGFATHLVHHTFEMKPSPFAFPPQPPTDHAKLDTAARLHPDELCIDWGNLPRDSHVTFYVPQVDTAEVLRFAARRQSPGHLRPAGAGTVRCRVADVSYIPIPGPFTQAIPGLISIQLPPNVTKGDRYTFVVRQVDGRTFRIVGTFQFTIEVGEAAEILPELVRNLSVLKHIALSIPAENRWYPVFERYLSELGDRVRALGVDPDDVGPSPTGSGQAEPRPRPEHPEKPPRARAADTGKVSSLLYDRHGDWEGFVLEIDCDRKLFLGCERALEEVVAEACRNRSTITVYSDADGCVIRIVVHCC